MTKLETLKAQLVKSEQDLEQSKAALYRTDGVVIALKFAIETLEAEEVSDEDSKDGNAS